jgi:hypothetical protein
MAGVDAKPSRRLLGSVRFPKLIVTPSITVAATPRSCRGKAAVQMLLPSRSL